MSQLLREVGAGGLAPCAIVFTVAALTGAACVAMLYGILRLATPIPSSYVLGISILVWLVCMTRTWKELAQARANWPNTSTSTYLFHVFQIAAAGICILFALMSRHLNDASTLGWFVLCFEVILAMFFLSYVFLGLTFRATFPRSIYIGLLVAVASAIWSYSHI